MSAAKLEMTEKLTHRITGEGEPVVLLNGGMMTFGSWEPVAAALRDRFRLLAFDFRGQLLSPGPGPSDLAGHAADVLALLDHVGWESAHLLGTSFGAEVALELAAAAPGRARSLVLVTAMDRVTPEFTAQTRAMRALVAAILAGGDRAPFLDALVDRVYSQEYREREKEQFASRGARVGELPLDWYAGTDRLLTAVADFDLTDRLHAIRAPACVVLSRADRVMEPERSLALAAALRAEVVEHPSSGHAIVAEEPAWLAAVCRDFLERQAELPAERSK